MIGVAFLACIVAANYTTARWGMVDVTFGLGLASATAGTYWAAATLVLRDAIASRAAVLVLIVTGAGLSYLVAPPSLALASGLAFACAELADWAIYARLRRRGRLRAAAASNVVGSVLDTLLFLAVAPFPITDDAVTGQLVGKLTVGLLPLALWWGGVRVRAVLRQPLQPGDS